MNRILIKAACPLKGRGFVVSGEVLDGILKKDMSLLYPYGSKHLWIKIIDAEFFDVSIKEKISHPALVLEDSLIILHGIQDKENRIDKTYNCEEAKNTLQPGLNANHRAKRGSSLRRH